MKKILEVNFRFKTRPELNQALLKAGLTPQVYANDVKGLEWRIALFNEAEKSAGGIYLFKDEASVEAYLNGELHAKMKSLSAVSDIEAKVFDIIPEATKICRGPAECLS
jgi:hypothetical protein